MSTLIVEVTDGGRKWILGNDFIFTLYNSFIVVPKGFTTDFASIPLILLPILGYGFKYSKASVIHDYLYSTQSLSRKSCDDIFLNVMIEVGINPIKAKLAYYAVRVFGGSHYGGKE